MSHDMNFEESPNGCAYIYVLKWGLKSSNSLFSLSISPTEFSGFTMPHHPNYRGATATTSGRSHSKARNISSSPTEMSLERYSSHFGWHFSTWWETKRAHEQFNQLLLLLERSTTWQHSSLSLSTAHSGSLSLAIWLGWAGSDECCG